LLRSWRRWGSWNRDGEIENRGGREMEMENENGEVDFLIMQEWDSYLLFENSDNSEIFLIPPTIVRQ
jgi:hypothetical protein